MLKRIINKWIEKAVAQEVANQNKLKCREDIYDKLRLAEVDRNELLSRSIQRTLKDFKPVNAKGQAMDAASVGGSLKNVFGVSNYAGFYRLSGLRFAFAKLDYQQRLQRSL